MKRTKKAFREYLNQQNQMVNEVRGENILWKHTGTRGQRTRLYGDYLYQADREMFNAEYQKWITQEVA